MDENAPAPFQVPRERGPWRVALLFAAIAGLLLLAGILWLGNPLQSPATPSPSQPLPPMNAEAEDYARSIAIGNLELSRWQNFLGQSVIYLDGRVSNSGARTLRALELTIEFQDAYGQVVLRETFRPIGGGRPSPVNPHAAPLKPGESRAFRAAFEDLPRDWNNAPPQVRVSGLLLE